MNVIDYKIQFSRDGVTVVFDENNLTKHYINSINGRIDLKAEVDEETYNAIIAVWGDTPTVVEPVITLTLEEAMIAKLSEVSATCEKTIFFGVDVEDSKGTEHFSLTIADQTNLSALSAAVAQGAAAVPYHADGQLCRQFTGEEFSTIYAAAKVHITLQTTLCNHLNVWIKRCTTVEEVQGITYSSPLPDDLQANFNSVLGITE